MHPKKFDNIARMSAAQRLDYFVRKCGDFTEIWVLFQGGEVFCRSDAARATFPLWPERAFADACLPPGSDAEDGIVVKSICAYEFVERRAAEMCKSSAMVCVFPTVEDAGVCLPPDELASMLRSELLRYDGDSTEGLS